MSKDAGGLSYGLEFRLNKCYIPVLEASDKLAVKDDDGKVVRLYKSPLWSITAFDALGVIFGLGMLLTGAFWDKGSGAFNHLACWEHSGKLLMGLGGVMALTATISIFSPFIKEIYNHCVYGPPKAGDPNTQEVNSEI